MNTDIFIENDDQVKLYNGTIITNIVQQAELYNGLDVNNNEVKFKDSDIMCIKKNYIKPCGGDYENYWMFYCGIGYKTKMIDIAHYAKFELDNIFTDLSIDDIMKYHIYWGTDEGTGYKAMYNGDTFVLFYNINALPEDKKYDAENAISRR